MNNVLWRDAVETYSEALMSMSVTAGDVAITPDEGFDRLETLTCTLREKGKTIYLIGNGASASMASHLSADLAKNAKIHTEVFSDLSLITAIANDLSFDEVFSEPLKTRAKQGDMLVAISSSGESANIIKAVDIARNIDMIVVTYTGFSGGNSVRKLGDINFYVDVDTYGAAESCHSMMLHHWMDRVTLG